ncbi:MAG: serine/threonine protein kinase [Planctomycetes bacterium]|nr:serine/threonine protein kinase [Planctomycetota bacterium]
MPPGRRSPRLGAWELQGLLGRGGMGELYAARHIERGTPAALKVLPGGLRDGEAVLRFQREVRALFAVRHPVVVTPLDAGRAPDGRPWLVMERVEGESLQARVARVGPLPPPEAARLVERLARALDQVHAQGVAHRDVKPDNVLLTPQGDVRLVDFGLARFLLAEGSLTATSELLGTPAYMAPEQADGRARQAGAAADVYGLGGTLFFALTGRPPFEGASALAVLEQLLRAAPPAPSSLAPGVPRELDAACLRCLEKDPAARFKSAGALAGALADALRPRRRRRRRRAWRWPPGPARRSSPRGRARDGARQRRRRSRRPPRRRWSTPRPDRPRPLRRRPRRRHRHRRRARSPPPPTPASPSAPRAGTSTRWATTSTPGSRWRASSAGPSGPRRRGRWTCSRASSPGRPDGPTSARSWRRRCRRVAGWPTRPAARRRPCASPRARPRP